ncbi:MAG: 4'-phosphopantetheinyl transferase EntD [Halioglobus sp.]|jgi:4'-phosphopantetheinyl transferase EntD
MYEDLQTSQAPTRYHSSRQSVMAQQRSISSKGSGSSGSVPSSVPIHNPIRDLGNAYSQTLCLYAPVHDAFLHLQPDEAASMGKAVSKRRNEYSTGRLLAHQALNTLQFPIDALLSGPKREPLWPAGIIGSIAHSDTYAVVAVSSNPQLRALGIDLERTGRAGEEILRRILTKAEQASLGDMDATLIFSAKEAVYKMLFPIVQKYVGFQDVEIRFDLNHSTFTTRYLGENPDCRCVESANGSFMKIDDSWLTQVYLERAGSR